MQMNKPFATTIVWPFVALSTALESKHVHKTTVGICYLANSNYQLNILRMERLANLGNNW